MSEPTEQRRRQRAGQACQRCHVKKIKCDLTEPNKTVQGRCQHCVTADAHCRLRPSNRGKRRRMTIPLINTEYPQRPGVSILNERLEAARALASGAEGLSHPSDNDNTTASLFVSYENPDDSRDHSSYDSGVLSERTPSVPSCPSALTIPDISDQSLGLERVFPSAAPSEEESLASQGFRSYLGDTGCMQIFSSDNTEVTSATALLMDRHHDMDDIPNELMQSYMETYHNDIYVWCPIMDRNQNQPRQELPSSLMLRHALALCGAYLRPPLIAHASCLDHYRRAKGLFYANYPDNPLFQVCAIMLFQWYRLDQPNLVSVDSNWWWVTTSIHLAQQIGLHREPNPDQTTRYVETLALRRRIWWTLFVRDRIAAFSQGRPLIIDADSCDVKAVTPDDFPDPRGLEATIFIHWVRLWDIAGQITKEVSRKSGQSKACLAGQLIHWVKSLPGPLQLPVGDICSLTFHRDVYFLHLGYLTVVILLHFPKGQESIPRPSISAVAAASCISRIFRVYLIRGSVRRLSAEASWYCTVAMLALLRARNIEGLTADAEDDMSTLRIALREISTQSKIGRMFYMGIERLLKAEPTVYSNPSHALSPNEDMHYFSLSGNIDHVSPTEGLEWMEYFPYVTVETSQLIANLMVKHCMAMPFPEMHWPDDITLDLQSFFWNAETETDQIGTSLGD